MCCGDFDSLIIPLHDVFIRPHLAGSIKLKQGPQNSLRQATPSSTLLLRNLEEMMQKCSAICKSMIYFSRALLHLLLKPVSLMNTL